jgi:predicted outer membrane protein
LRGFPYAPTFVGGEAGGMTSVPRIWFLRLGLLAGGLLVAASSDGRAGATNPPVTADVLGTLHEADQKEIQAGEIAQKNGQSKAVKDYGKMLVKDHTVADDKVAELAQHERVDLVASTPAPGPNDMGTMASGADFDRKFAQEMLDDHRKALGVLTDARDTTTDPQLRKLLTDLIPMLEKHEAAAERIIDAEARR